MDFGLELGAICEFRPIDDSETGLKFQRKTHCIKLFQLSSFPHFYHDRCLHVALGVSFLEIISKPVAQRATTATRAGCVQRGLGRETPS